MTVSSHYETLGLAKDADKQAVKRAYFKLVKEHTPDGDPEGFQALREAYQVLSDDKARAAYDKTFNVPERLRNALNPARQLMTQARYKQAIEYLNGLCKVFPDEYEAELLLALAYHFNGNNGKAQKLCEKYVMAGDGDMEMHKLLAKVYTAMGHVMKARQCYFELTERYPNEPSVWNNCVRFFFQDHLYEAYRYMEQADSISREMFKDDYFVYLLAASEFAKYDKGDAAVKYFTKFTDYFIADKHPTMELYNSTVIVVKNLTVSEGLFFPAIDKILPMLLESGYRQPFHEEKFKAILKAITLKNVIKDKRLGETVINLVHIIKNECDCVDCKRSRLILENNLVMKPEQSRKQVKALRDNYPDVYKENEAFYQALLDVKQEVFLQSQYGHKIEEMERQERKNRKRVDDKFFTDTLEHNIFEEFFTSEPDVPFVRETPKVGRNAPCPCGSGKKYKHCCGKSA
jgi:tetratricopeptide (TPR) repeat protein